MLEEKKARICGTEGPGGGLDGMSKVEIIGLLRSELGVDDPNLSAMTVPRLAAMVQFERERRSGTAVAAGGSPSDSVGDSSLQRQVHILTAEIESLRLRIAELESAGDEGEDEENETERKEDGDGPECGCQAALPPYHYLVDVTNEPVPHWDTLKATGEFDRVSVVFDGRQWIRSYPVGGKDVPVGDMGGRTVFLLKYFGESMFSEGVIDWGLGQRTDFAPDGYRPATEIEARAFALVNPGLQLDNPIIALGAFCLDDGDRCVAVLDRFDVRRAFDDRCFGNGWSSAYSFLLVRK